MFLCEAYFQAWIYDEKYNTSEDQLNFYDINYDKIKVYI